MLTFAWVLVFVKRRAVKARQRKRIFGKVRGHPIHDHAQTFLMKIVDQEAKIVRRAITRRRRKVRADLIAP